MTILLTADIPDIDVFDDDSLTEEGLDEPSQVTYNLPEESILSDLHDIEYTPEPFPIHRRQSNIVIHIHRRSKCIR